MLRKFRAHSEFILIQKKINKSQEVHSLMALVWKKSLGVKRVFFFCLVGCFLPRILRSHLGFIFCVCWPQSRSTEPPADTAAQNLPATHSGQQQHQVAEDCGNYPLRGCLQHTGALRSKRVFLFPDFTRQVQNLMAQFSDTSIKSCVVGKIKTKTAAIGARTKRPTAVYGSQTEVRRWFF